MALATARAATGRERVLAFQGGYHGGVLSFASGVGSPINAPFAYDGFVGGGRGLLRAG